MGAVETVLGTALLYVTTWIEPESTRGWVPTLAMGPDMVTICGEGGLELDEESDELGEESVWGLEGL